MMLGYRAQWTSDPSGPTWNLRTNPSPCSTFDFFNQQRAVNCIQQFDTCTKHTLTLTKFEVHFSWRHYLLPLDIYYPYLRPQNPGCSTKSHQVNELFQQYHLTECCGGRKAQFLGSQNMATVTSNSYSKSSLNSYTSESSSGT
jgi:hypothetical protein